MSTAAANDDEKLPVKSMPQLIGGTACSCEHYLTEFADAAKEALGHVVRIRTVCWGKDHPSTKMAQRRLNDANKGILSAPVLERDVSSAASASQNATNSADSKGSEKPAAPAGKDSKGKKK